MFKAISMLSERKKNVLAVMLITALAFIIYSNSFDCSFHFDDQHSIVENYRIQRFDLKKILHTNRPVLELTLAANYYFGKLNVFGYHLVNLLLHIFNGIMVYFILLYTLKSPVFSKEKKVKYGRVSIYAALIFIAHPIQTESVTYIISRSSVLATFFYLLTLLFFIMAHRFEKGKSGYRRFMLYAGCIIASILGMGTKPIAATLPIMVILYDFYFVADGDIKKTAGRYKFYLLLLLTVFVAIHINVHGLNKSLSFVDYAAGPSGEVPAAMAELATQTGPLTSMQYFMTQMHVIPYYIKLLFIPTNLNLDYDFPITRKMNLSTFFFLILLSALFILAIWLYKRSRLVSYGILWFFITLSVTSSFIVILDVIFEHRLYLPSFGFAVFLAVLISNISSIKWDKIKISYNNT